MRIRQIYSLLVAAVIAIFVVMSSNSSEAAEYKVNVDCDPNSPSAEYISLNPGDKVRFKEKNNLKFKIKFEKTNDVGGRKSPFKRCFLFICGQKKKVGHGSATKGNSVVKETAEGCYGYTIYCKNGTVIDPMIQIPRVVVADEKCSKPS